MKMNRILGLVTLLLFMSILISGWVFAKIGKEVAVSAHLEDGEEFSITLKALIAHGQRLFSANWTIQEGAGRPLTKGTGAELTDLSNSLVFPRNNNRVSAPDANSCAGCHNAPFGIAGGGGDFVTSVFVLGQRFDFATFDQSVGSNPTESAFDENGNAVTLQTIANRRATLGMFGSGYIEMLARQMTTDLQAIRDATRPGQSRPLVTKGISFGVIARNRAGNWKTSRVEGLPATSLHTTGSGDPPSLIIRPFHQAGAVVSIREFTNNAFNHHHGIQSTERFGNGTDPDGDGFKDELTRADVTASAVHQATLAVPGRVIPNDPDVETAVLKGEKLFEVIGCDVCHKPKLPLTNRGWMYKEPNPFNPPGNLQVGDAPILTINLNSRNLPSPRLEADSGVVDVPAYTDLKLHNITDGSNDPNREPLDMLQPAGSPGFFAGNGRFLTRKLWGVANEPPYFHHGQYTTLREAVEAHAGEAQASRDEYGRLSSDEQDTVIEFLKTLQILPPGTKHRIVDENGNLKRWPPNNADDDEDDDDDDD